MSTASTGKLTLYEVRWVCGAREGTCWIRALDQDDAITEFQEHAGWYGCPHSNGLVVWAKPVARVERSLRGSLSS